MTNPIIDKNGTKRWYRKGCLHRADGPAVEHSDGTKSWYQDGLIHREDGPAIEYISGRREWYKNGKPHREDGPAIENVGGGWTSISGETTKKNPPPVFASWYRDGELHREDGPAIERVSGDKYWFNNGTGLDSYKPNFGCFDPKNRKEALERLNAKERPYSYELYVADIDNMFPEGKE